MFFKKKLLTIVGLLFSVFFISTESKSQIVPDNSLPNDSNVLREGNVLKIKEGTIRGDNLFHSFSQFSVPSELEASFNNEINIKNIFTRVTGDSASIINGRISANESANLFLINPNGIIFGENGQLDIGGSFLATTANEIEFSDGTKFNSIEPENPILTISIPIGLDFGTNPESISGDLGLITVNGSGHSLDALGGNSVIKGEGEANLSVLPSKNLALIGKEVRFSGGVLVSPSGNLDVASIRQGKVGITNPDNIEGGWKLDYEDAEVFGNITFANRSLLDSSSISSSPQLSGGSITVKGSNIFSKDGSVILNQNFGESNSGSINVNASESFRISGTDPVALILGGIRGEALSSGNGADINISTPQLSLFDGGSIQTFAFGSFPQTTSGNINLNVSDLRVSGASPLSEFSVSSISTFTFNVSQSGNIAINSDTISIKNGGTLGSSGILGPVGNVTINATELIVIQGFQPTLFIPSAIFSTNSSSPNPGSINVSAPSLQIRDGASISTSTFAGGNAGSIFINADNLEIVGKIPQSTFIDFDIPSNISSSTTAFNSRLIETLPDRIDIDDFVDLPLTGNSGQIEISANSLQVNDSGQIIVANGGLGNAGELQIKANVSSLNNGGKISASSVSGEGGNIAIDSEKLSLLNQSQITASAGEEGNGGNIEINSETILGLNNSDITANAVGGNGGNIEINSDFILGLESRSQPTPFNDITASSELGIDGTVTINSPENNSEEDVLISALEVGIYTGQELFPDSCNNRDGRGMKIAYLNGGSPESPDDFYDDEEPLPLPREESVSSKLEIKSEDNVPPLWNEGDPVVEGNMIQTNSDGSVYFVAVDQQKTAESMVCSQESKSR